MGANQNIQEKRISLKKKGLKNLNEIKRYETAKNLKNLKVLVLSKNKLTQLDPLVLKDFASLNNIHDTLRELNLSFNKIQVIPEAFLGLVNLSHLRLDNNEIQVIPEDFAECLYNLSDLCLDHNKIEEIPWNMSKLKQLRSITLHDNNISYVPPTFAELLLEDLSLHNNPLDPSLFQTNTIEGTLEAIRLQKIPKKYHENVGRLITSWEVSIKGKTEVETQFLFFLQSPSFRKPFYAYMEKEYSHENLDFWSQVDDFRTKYYSKLEIHCSELVENALSIYKQFIEDGAPHSINIPAEEGRTIKTLFKSPKFPEGINQWVFENAYEAIFKLMYSDTFSRYRITEEGELNFKKAISQWQNQPIIIIKKLRK
eukprot:TRINITY_DN4230_c0_g1_i1.p1 TRINITY_DN4230_c0_g1~~TRINITY_DN4230_c0_g1_i1.p1  ORF type:complete len:369 (+),score=102.04 TRINITY_DN4230_c0_g1_i1:1364-2470(+)